MAELIHNVPIEILMKYFDSCDLRTAIRLASSSVNLQNLLGGLITSKEQHYVGNIVYDIVCALKAFHEDLTSMQTRYGLLSFMLRRLIYTTAIYDTIDTTDANILHYSKYQEEYNDVFLQINEEMDMDLKEFNGYLENAQFEYRGFTIIGLPTEQRQKLDIFKQILENRYFNEPLKLQAYFAYADNVFVEIIFDGENVEFDFHMRVSETGQWIFIDQSIASSHILLEHVEEKNRMMCFHHQNNKAVHELIDIIFNIFYSSVKGNLVKGAEQTNVSIWNNMYEDNALLAETISNYMSNYNIEGLLHNITGNCLS
jgi:hypothetical protein